MATLTAVQVTNAGVAGALAAASAGGDKVAPAGILWLEVANGGGSPITVTVDSVLPSNFGTDVNLVVSVTNGQRRLINLSEAGRLTNPTDGLIAWTYSAVTSVTVGAFYM